MSQAQAIKDGVFKPTAEIKTPKFDAVVARMVQAGIRVVVQDDFVNGRFMERMATSKDGVSLARAMLSDGRETVVCNRRYTRLQRGLAPVARNKS